MTNPPPIVSLPHASVRRLLQKNAGDILKQQNWGNNSNKQPTASDVLKLFHH
jgi:hypothetical protein